MSAQPDTVPARRRRRWPLALVWLLALALGAAIVAAWWIVGTQGGARLVIDRAVSALGKGAKIEGVEGQLGGTLRIKLIEVARPDLQVRIEDVEMDTEPLEWGRLLVHRLYARSVEVRTATTSAAASIPVTFEPPYPVKLEDGRVGELRFGTLKGDRANDVVIRNFAVKGEGGDKQWTIAEAGAETPYGSLALAGTLGTRSPFTVAADGRFEGSRDGRAFRLDAKLSGTLKALEAKLAGEFGGARGTGRAQLSPFDAKPIDALALQLRDVDLAAFTAAPHTRLALDMDLAPRGKEFSGPIRVENAEPGPFDQGRLPFVSATAKASIGPGRAEITDATLALAGGGSARGKAIVEQGRVQADLRIEQADLAALHRDFQSTRVSGTVAITGTQASQRFDVALHDARVQLEGKAVAANQKLEIETVKLRHGAGSITGAGTLALAGRREFRFEGRAEHFDPSVLFKAPAGDLNFAFTATGTLAGGVAGELQADLAASRYMGLPAGGSIRVSGDRQRIASADIHVSVGESKLDAKGSFGRPGDALDVTLHAPNVSVFAKPLGWPVAGSVDAQARLTGTFAAPAGRASLKAANLALPSGVRVKELALRGDVGAEATSPIEATLEAKEITRGGDDPPFALAQSVAAKVSGTRAAHRLDIDALMRRNETLKASLQGGLAEARGRASEWRGNVQSLVVSGPSAFALAAPATLVVSAQHVELGDAAIKADWGEAHLAVTRWTPERLELKGSSRGLAIASAARALRLPNVPRSSLVVAGEWDVRAADTVDGKVSLKRLSGDLRIGDPPLALGLEELALTAESVRGRARAVVDIRGTHLGRLQGEATATLARGEQGWELASAAPLAGRFDVDVPSLEWFAAWLGPDARVAGALNAHLDLAGTAGDPRWSGSGRAENVRLREPQTGFEIDQGRALLRVRERSIVIEQLAASTPWNPSDAARRALAGAPKVAAGSITAEGSVDLAAGTGTIRVKADKVPVTQLPSRFVVLSGEAELHGRKDGVLVTGALKSDAAWIGALAEPLPTVSDDIVVVRAQAEPVARARDRINLDVRLALGEHTYFAGRGLNTKLDGELHIVGEPGAALRATGSIRTVEGTYDAYGQKLTIDHGTLTFYGSLESPAMNVLALRRGLPVEAGVEVLGTANRPRVRLVSFPEVPEPEKLTWLVLGRSPGDVSQGDAATLVAAARAILGRGDGSDIARRFGFDDVRIGRSDTTSALGALPQTTVAGRTATASAAEVVSVGKRLGKDVHVVYEQGLADAEGALRITWQITKKFQLLLRAGYLPGVDAVYRWTFN